MRLFVHWVAVVAAAAALSSGAATSAIAQGNGTVRGRVVDAANQQPLADAQISIGGTTLGGATGANGEYTILNVPPGERIVTARRIGYTPRTLTVTVVSGAEVRADFAMPFSATQLDKVVVTGTALGAEQRTVSNSITTIDVSELVTKAPVMNVSDILQGKAPGVTILPGSGTPGTAGEIRIRGAGSVSGYRPIIYIDGIRYNSESVGNFAAGGFGVTGNILASASQVTSALDMLNPNDIESIEILKGPSAATLYGANAANGVIQIITKKGTRGQQKIRWSARFDRGVSEWVLPIPNNYITCDSAKIASTDASGRLWPGCQNVQRNTMFVDNPIGRDPRAIRDGDIQRIGLSMTGGGDLYSFYIGGDHDTEQGVQFSSFNNRLSTRGNFSFTPSAKIGFNVLMNYIRGDLRLPLGDDSNAGVLLNAVRGRPGVRLAPSTDFGWNTYDPGTSNRYNNRTKSERLTLGGTVNFKPFEWFTNRLTLGVDNTIGQAALLYLPGDEGEPQGATLARTPITRVLSMDYGGSIPFTLREDFEFTTSFGTQIISTRAEALNATGLGLGSPDVTLIGSATTTTGSNSFSESNSVGYYIEERMGWKDRLFVTGAFRADDHSAFGTNFDWILYPKVGLSWVVSEEPTLSSVVNAARITTFKLRTAWGRAGRAPAPYSATQTYSVDRAVLPNGSIGSALRVLSFGNPNLKPEKGQEIEAGFDAGFFADRLGIDFTWYDKSTTDMLTTVATAASTGFPVNRLANLGEVTNTGVEVGVSGTPVQRDQVVWETRVSYSANKNRLEDFGIPGRTREIVTSTAGNQSYATVQEHRLGYPLAGYWAQLPLLNPDGTPQLTTAGAVILDTAKYIGPSSPNQELGFSNTVTIAKNVRVYALLDWKGGMYLFNQKERQRCQTGVDNCWLVNDPRVRNPQTPSDSLRAKWLNVYRTVPGYFIEPADFTKLREVSLTYTVPPRLLGRLAATGASITLSGRNLALWSDYSGIDPETNSYGGRTFLRVDAYATPNPRKFVGTINLNF